MFKFLDGDGVSDCLRKTDERAEDKMPKTSPTPGIRYWMAKIQGKLWWMSRKESNGKIVEKRKKMITKWHKERR